jgi:hypothetical protein
VASNPEVPDTRIFLAACLVSAGHAEARLGRRAGAAASFRESIAVLEAIPEPARTPTSRFNLACSHARLSGVLAGSGPAGAAEARAEADRAMVALRDAVALGVGLLDLLRTDTDLDTLRDRSDFRALVMDVAFPHQPFAPSE